jgi:carbonic anhydrase/acetyltransferase-like protein (isoleucine patch superfamily)
MEHLILFVSLKYEVEGCKIDNRIKSIGLSSVVLELSEIGFDSFSRSWLIVRVSSVV